MRDRRKLPPGACLGAPARGYMAPTDALRPQLPETPPLRSMPDWLMPRIGPRGLAFARARVEMKAAETVLHLRHAHPAKMRNMVPAHVWDLVKPYGPEPGDGERER